MKSNREAFERAKQVLVGGVNSPVRAFRAVGREPIFIAAGRGSRVWDIEGREYVDFVGAWGPMILGHADPDVVEAVQSAAENSFSFGMPTEAETELAEEIRKAFPSIEKVRFVNSGTEATMAALRLARGFTGRNKILKFAGCYHGHSDGLLVRAGSGATTLGVPDSAGVPGTFASETLLARYNDLEDVDRILEEYERELAAVIVEPVAGNMGVIPPAEGFLEGLRSRCDEAGAVLIFDEVMTGFRVARGGAQERFGVRPDLTCLGKIIGGGLPVGAYGGKKEIMEFLSPEGPVYQAGTNSGNPIAMAAGLATVRKLRPGVYETLENLGSALESLLASRFAGEGIVQRVGSMLTLFFPKDEVLFERGVRNYDDVARVDAERYGRFFHAAVRRGALLPPSAYEAFFLSVAHSSEELERLIGE
ncbi:MAG: glutamate-1-semialdehyde-2,1-aminomutase [Candidatus Hydrogenedentota bacterium]|nr:MAG: glutamate-1-semialdehyde-2,1-aminomutase [Candidatus Hydrogenedentota bacterium]